jgi:phospholipase C
VKTRIELLLLVLLTCVAINFGCGGGTTTASFTPANPTTPTNGTGGTASTGSTGVPQLGHVFLVIEENHGFSSVIGNSAMPFLNQMAAKYGLATQYFAVAHPSLPNYFMLTTGQTITFDDSFSGTVTQDNVVRELVAAGKTWKAYAESLPSVGYTGGDVLPYVKHHNPVAYFSDVVNDPAQAANLVPFSMFAGDLAGGRLPNYSLIVPDLLDDAHDCPGEAATCTDNQKLAAADAWLSANIGPLINSAQFQQDGLLIITFDEAEQSDITNGGGRVAMLVISPRAKPGFQSSTFYQHQSTLRLMLEALGVGGRPGASSSAQSAAEFFH